MSDSAGKTSSPKEYELLVSGLCKGKISESFKEVTDADEIEEARRRIEASEQKYYRILDVYNSKSLWKDHPEMFPPGVEPE